MDLAARVGYSESRSSFTIEDVMEVVMRRSLAFLMVLSAALVTGGERCQVSAAENPVANDDMVPVHCRIPAHSARFFAGSVGVAIGFGTENELQACLLLHVASAND